MKSVTLPASAPQQRFIDAEASALLRQLVNATPAQVQAYMTANVTNLAQARDVLTALALAVRYLYRQGQQ